MHWWSLTIQIMLLCFACSAHSQIKSLESAHLSILDIDPGYYDTTSCVLWNRMYNFLGVGLPVRSGVRRGPQVTYCGKLLREKTSTNFDYLQNFSLCNLEVWHLLAAQAICEKFSLHSLEVWHSLVAQTSNLWMFSPSKVFCYTVQLPVSFPDPSMPGAGKRLFTVQISKTLESFESSSGIQLSLSKIVTVDVTKK